MENYTLVAVPILEGLQPSHPAHRAAMMELLQSEPKPATETSDGAPGSKGVSHDLVWQLAPTVPVTVGALVRAWRLWLQRDRRRSLHITVKESGATKTEFEVSGENISLESVEKAIEAALDREAGAKGHGHDVE
jgi:hypothetical protein